MMTQVGKNWKKNFNSFFANFASEWYSILVGFRIIENPLRSKPVKRLLNFLTILLIKKIFFGKSPFKET